MGDILKDVARIFFARPDTRCRAYIRFMEMSRRRGRMRLVNFFSNRLKRYGVHISARAQVSPRAKFPHPTAIVIGDGVVIEDDVRIFQCVTVGAVRVGEGQAGRYPRIGRGTTVFAGAVIAGGIRIGENCTIGANSVVLTDIPDNSTCVGVPARIIAPHPQSEKVSG